MSVVHIEPIGHAEGVCQVKSKLLHIGSLGATIATWSMNVGPAWYSLSVVVLAIPSALAGAKLFEASKRARSSMRPTPLGAAT